MTEKVSANMYLRRLVRVISKDFRTYTSNRHESNKIQELNKNAVAPANKFEIMESDYYDKNESRQLMRYTLRNRNVEMQRRKELEEKFKQPQTITMTKLAQMFNDHKARSPNAFSFSNIRRWYENLGSSYREVSQKYDEEKHMEVGHDIAAGFFVLVLGGRIKFKDHEWMPYDNGTWMNAFKIPRKYDPTYILTDIDLSGINITYEGLRNICGLTYLRWLSLKNSKLLTDWCMDRISGEFPFLEYLDVSGCPKITEKGLEGLYRLPSLKTFIITDYYNSPALELTCLMLEEVNPYLTCEILKPRVYLKRRQ